ncbi:MAG: EAL domain-containing protein [Blastocatellia bacterium]
MFISPAKETALIIRIGFYIPGRACHQLRVWREQSESILMDNVDVAIAMLRQIRAPGIELSIADFGKRFSSLSDRRRFHINTLRVDRSFVISIRQNEENRDIARTIVTLANAPRLDVIAEDIETAGQLPRLSEPKYRYGQGYYFPAPSPPQKTVVIIGSAHGNTQE